MGRFLRGLAGLVVGSGLLVLSCHGDDTPPSFFDGGVDGASEASEASGDADAAAPARVLFVNASADLGPVSLCFGIGEQNDGSDSKVGAVAPTQSIAPGAGSLLSGLGDLSANAVTPYALLTKSIGTSMQTCDALVKSLGAGTDYFVLPTLKYGTFARGATVLVTITGCVPTSVDPSADMTTCGTSYDTTLGNLVGDAYALDPVVVNTQRFGAQVVYASSAVSGVWYGLYGTRALVALLRPFDGGADEIIASGVGYPSIAPPNAASLAPPTVDQTSLVVFADNGDAGGSTAIPLPSIYTATTGQVTGENTYFANGNNYTFVIVGDPRAPLVLDGGVFNGFALHALAFPNL